MTPKLQSYLWNVWNCEIQQPNDIFTDKNQWASRVWIKSTTTVQYSFEVCCHIRMCVGLCPVWTFQLNDRAAGHRPGNRPSSSPLICAATLPSTISSEVRVKGVKGFLRWTRELLRRDQKPPLPPWRWIYVCLMVGGGRDKALCSEVLFALMDTVM